MDPVLWCVMLTVYPWTSVGIFDGNYRWQHKQASKMILRQHFEKVLKQLMPLFLSRQNERHCHAVQSLCLCSLL